MRSGPHLGVNEKRSISGLEHGFIFVAQRGCIGELSSVLWFVLFSNDIFTQAPPGRNPEDIVCLLLQLGAHVNATSGFTGMTSLHLACRSKNVSFELVKTLLDNGADVKALVTWSSSSCATGNLTYKPCCR